MSFLMIFLFMVFFHIVDDFYLQGCLAKFKQKRYWQDINNYPRTVIDEQLMFDDHNKYEEYQQQEEKTIREYMKKCRYDFSMALFLHSFSWTFMVMLPIMVTNYYRLNEFSFGVIFLANVLLHMTIDNLKCNELKITLFIDQIIHLMQVIIIFIFFRMGWLFY